MLDAPDELVKESAPSFSFAASVKALSASWPTETVATIDGLILWSVKREGVTNTMALLVCMQCFTLYL